MNYQEALNYILSFTDFEKLPPSYWSRQFDLRRMDEFLEGLGNPHLASRSVLVAGSKGKGSTAAMIASALSAAGYRTGLYTSPHLHTFRERIRIGGDLISEEELAAFTERLKPEIEAVNFRHSYGELTTFEILTTMAFTYFRDKKVDFQVLEVGLGGRLDATNVVRPEVSVITSISMEHAEVLGNSLEQIAREKAGIVKPGAVVVSSPQRGEVAEVIGEVCLENGARVIIVGRDVSWRKLASDLGGQTFEVQGKAGRYNLTIPLLGEHQLENAATAVAALEVLGIGADDIAVGLANVHWPGRLEILRQRPLFLVDGAHNDESARRLKDAIEQNLDFERLILVLGVSSDKDMAAIVRELASLCSLAIVTRSRHPRALEPRVLLEEVERLGIKGEVKESVSSAVERALQVAGPEDLICATGSLFVVAEAREYIKHIPGEVYPS
jgi:dihydrofolate synthase/folylpolyglutamate synthase